MADPSILEGYNSTPLHGAQPCQGEGMDRSQWKLLTKHGPVEEETATYSSILAVRTLGTV